MEVGQVILGKVYSIKKTHLIVEFKNDWKGLLHVSKISDYFVSSIQSMFNVGERYWFKIVKINEKEKRVKLSWKSLMPRFVKDPFESAVEETEQGFKNLLKKTLEEAEND